MKKVKAREGGKLFVVVERVVTGAEKCPGEAHENPYVDNCMRCAPRWGVVDTYAEVDVLAATKAGFAVPLSYVSDEARDAAALSGKTDEITVIEKTRAYTKSYIAIVSYLAIVKRSKATIRATSSAAEAKGRS